MHRLTFLWRPCALFCLQVPAAEPAVGPAARHLGLQRQLAADAILLPGQQPPRRWSPNKLTCSFYELPPALRQPPRPLEQRAASAAHLPSTCPPARPLNRPLGQAHSTASCAQFVHLLHPPLLLYTVHTPLSCCLSQPFLPSPAYKLLALPHRSCRRLAAQQVGPAGCLPCAARAGAEQHLAHRCVWFFQLRLNSTLLAGAAWFKHACVLMCMHSAAEQHLAHR